MKRKNFRRNNGSSPTPRRLREPAAKMFESYYHTPGPALLAAFPVILRAGHLQASADYAVDRRCLPGHDLLFCLGGGGRVRVRNRVFPVSKGQLVWINGYQPHAHWADPSDPWELYWLRFDGAGVEALRTLLGADEDPVFKCEPRREVVACFREILRLMAGSAVHREENVHIVLARLTAILRRCRNPSSGSSDRAVPLGVEMAINRMALYPQYRWTAKELATLGGMSVPGFYRTFRQVTGSSPIDWLRRERISLAKRRLQESNDSIKAVADLAGYNSPFYFSRDFKRYTGQAPSAFRRQEQAGPVAAAKKVR